MAKHCANCGAALEERGKFCHRCGAARDGGGAAASGAPASGSTSILPWAIAGIAVLALVAFIAGQKFGGGAAAPNAANASAVGPAGAAGGGGGGARAVDIASMSPQERADRLFDRVMTLVSQGKSDSVQFFAPMAIQSFQALAPLDAHGRYDLGLLGVVSGDATLARAQSDTILTAQPSHLLGLILGMRAAGLQGDTQQRAQFAQRLSASLVSERAKGLPEYTDHGPDIDAALKEADGRTPLPR